MPIENAPSITPSLVFVRFTLPVPSANPLMPVGKKVLLSKSIPRKILPLFIPVTEPDPVLTEMSTPFAPRPRASTTAPASFIAVASLSPDDTVARMPLLTLTRRLS